MFVEKKKSVFNIVQAIYDISSTSQIAKGRYKFGFPILVSPEKDNVAKLFNLEKVTEDFLFIEELAGKENIELNNILFACLCKGINVRGKYLY